MGETLRRLTGKAAVRQLREKLCETLSPLQWGVSTSRGCATIAHTIRNYLHRHLLNILKIAGKANGANLPHASTGFSLPAESEILVANSSRSSKPLATGLALGAPSAPTLVGGTPQVLHVGILGSSHRASTHIESGSAAAAEWFAVQRWKPQKHRRTQPASLDLCCSRETPMGVGGQGTDTSSNSGWARGPAYRA